MWFIIFSEVLIEDSNGRWDIYSFVLSFFGFAVGPVVEVGVSESAAQVWPFGTRSLSAREWYCQLSWFRDGSDGAILLLRVLLRVYPVGYVEKAWNNLFVVTLVWSFSPALEAVDLTPLVRSAPRWHGGRHFHQAVYLTKLIIKWSQLSDTRYHVSYPEYLWRFHNSNDIIFGYMIIMISWNNLAHAKISQSPKPYHRCYHCYYIIRMI